MRLNRLLISALGLALVAPGALAHETGLPHGGHDDGRTWLAGDHHVHSQFSVDWKPAADPAQPPEPVIGGDSSNTIPTNARMARKYGLSWMAATDDYRSVFENLFPPIPSELIMPLAGFTVHEGQMQFIPSFCHSPTFTFP